jgi:hypothetical protein
VLICCFIRGTYFTVHAECFEPLLQCEDISLGWDFYIARIGGTDMPKARATIVRNPAALTASEANGELVIVALFSGAGLLLSLTAIIAGMSIAGF